LETKSYSRLTNKGEIEKGEIEKGSKNEMILSNISKVQN